MKQIVQYPHGQTEVDSVSEAIAAVKHELQLGDVFTIRRMSTDTRKRKVSPDLRTRRYKKILVRGHCPRCGKFLSKQVRFVQLDDVQRPPAIVEKPSTRECDGVCRGLPPCDEDGSFDEDLFIERLEERLFRVSDESVVSDPSEYLDGKVPSCIIDDTQPGWLGRYFEKVHTPGLIIAHWSKLDCFSPEEIQRLEEMDQEYDELTTEFMEEDDVDELINELDLEGENP